MPIVRVMVAVALFGFAPSCSGDSPVSQDDARDRASEASCDFAMRCMDIGAGEKYETRSDCEIATRADWNKAWPPEDCEGKIDETALDVCITAIGITACDNPADFLNTLAKCAKGKICVGTPDGGAED